MKKDKVLLVVTSAARYMRDAMIKMTEVFPKMIHVNCLARDFQHISECVRMSSADVENLICRVASVFDKTPLFCHEFRKMNSEVPLPPASTQFTQWSTWIEAAIYCARYFNEMKVAVQCFSESDTEAVKRAHNAFLTHTVKANLAFISANFNFFPDAINEIQKRGISLARSINVIDEVYAPLAAMKFPLFRDEFDRLLQNNRGFEKLKSINLILNGNLPDCDEFKEYTPVELAKYALAPVTLCNVGHTFAAFKSVLTDQEVPLDQLKEHAIVYCNDF